MEKQSFRTVVPALLLLMLIVFAGGLPRRLASPLLLRIASDFSVTYDVASTIFLTGSIGFIVGLLTSGFVSSYLTHRWTIAASGGLTGLAAIGLSLTHSLTSFHVAFVLVGIASGFYPGSGLASVQSLAAADHRGKALGFHELAPNVTFVVAPILVALLAPSVGWRGVMRTAGVAALAGTALFVAAGRSSTERGEPPHLTNLRLFARNRAFWVLTAILTLAVSGVVGVYSVMPTFLATVHGMDEAVVNGLVSGGRIVAFGSMLAAGWLLDRYGYRPVARSILIAGGIATVAVGVSGGPMLAIAVVLQPAIIGAYLPISWAALSDAVPPHVRSLSVSLAIALSNLLAAGAAPRILAAVGAAGAFGTGFVVLGAAIAAGSAILFLLPRGNDRLETMTT